MFAYLLNRGLDNSTIINLLDNMSAKIQSNGSIKGLYALHSPFSPSFVR